MGVVLTGSAARGDWVEGWSDIDCILFLEGDEDRPSKVAQVQSVLDEYYPARVSLRSISTKDCKDFEDVFTALDWTNAPYPLIAAPKLWETTNIGRETDAVLLAGALPRLSIPKKYVKRVYLSGLVSAWIKLRPLLSMPEGRLTDSEIRNVLVQTTNIARCLVRLAGNAEGLPHRALADTAYACRSIPKVLKMLSKDYAAARDVWGKYGVDTNTATVLARRATSFFRAHGNDCLGKHINLPSCARMVAKPFGLK